VVVSGELGAAGSENNHAATTSPWERRTESLKCWPGVENRPDVTLAWMRYQHSIFQICLFEGYRIMWYLLLHKHPDMLCQVVVAAAVTQFAYLLDIQANIGHLIHIHYLVSLPRL
jgi:hypothetical protein